MAAFEASPLGISHILPVSIFLLHAGCHSQQDVGFLEHPPQDSKQCVDIVTTSH